SPFIPSATTLIYTLSLHDALPIFRIENVRPERDEKLSVPQTRRSESIKRHTRLPPPFPDSDSSRGETQPKGAGLFSTSLDCFYTILETALAMAGQEERLLAKLAAQASEPVWRPAIPLQKLTSSWERYQDRRCARHTQDSAERRTDILIRLSSVAALPSNL